MNWSLKTFERKKTHDFLNNNLLLGPSPIIKSRTLSNTDRFGITMGLGRRARCCCCCCCWAAVIDGGCCWAPPFGAAIDMLDKLLCLFIIVVLFAVSFGFRFAGATFIVWFRRAASCCCCCCCCLLATLRWMSCELSVWFSILSFGPLNGVFIDMLFIDDLFGEIGGVMSIELVEKRSSISLAFLYVSFSFTSSSF